MENEVHCTKYIWYIPVDFFMNKMSAGREDQWVVKRLKFIFFENKRPNLKVLKKPGKSWNFKSLRG